MACAVMTKVPKGSIYTTLEYKVNIIKPIPQNRQIHAIGVTNHVGRSTGVATAEIVDAETGKIIRHRQHNMHRDENVNPMRG